MWLDALSLLLFLCLRPRRERWNCKSLRRRDKPCLSAFAKQTIARRAIHGTRSVNGICLRQIAFVPNAGQARLVPTACRGVFDVGTSLARPVRRRRTIARRAIYGTRSVNVHYVSQSVVGICLRQIAFVPNAGQARLVPTASRKVFERIGRDGGGIWGCLPTASLLRKSDQRQINGFHFSGISRDMRSYHFSGDARWTDAWK